MPTTHNNARQRGRWYALVATMTGPGSVRDRNIRWKAFTEDQVSRPVSSRMTCSRAIPACSSSVAMTDASDGPWRPTAPDGMNRTHGSPLAWASAVSTRRRRAVLGVPSGRTAAPKIRIVVILRFDVRFPIENNLEDAIMARSCATRLLGVGLIQGIGLNPRGTHMRFVSTRALSAAGLLTSLALAACSSTPPAPPPPPPPVVQVAPPAAPPMASHHKGKRHHKGRKHHKM
jgi:hypothetical protein